MRQELRDIEKRMSDAVHALREKFKTLRTGRANLGLLDGILVSAYGSEVPINQVANLSVPEPTLIVAAPWDPNHVTRHPFPECGGPDGEYGRTRQRRRADCVR